MTTIDHSPMQALALCLASLSATGARPRPELHLAVVAGLDEICRADGAALYDALTPPLCSRQPHHVLQWLKDVGLLARLLPELEATVAFSQEGGRRHKDVWDHTKAVVWQAVPRPTVRWAAALHDIGKVPTRRFGPGGKVTFHGHAEEGARMFRRGPARRVTFPPEVARDVDLLIRHHLRGGQYDGSWTDSAVRRFAKDMEPFLRDLLDLSRADITSRRPGKRKRALELISELSARIRKLQAEDAVPKALPPGLGGELMQALGLPPGKHIGRLREALEALVEAGEIEGGRLADYYRDVVLARGLHEGLVLEPPRGHAPGVTRESLLGSASSTGTSTAR